VVERCLAPGFRARSGFPPESQVPMVFATPGGSDSRDRFRVEISGSVTCAALIKLAANKICLIQERCLRWVNRVGLALVDNFRSFPANGRRQGQ
jgi:hypothetical protein